MQLDANEVIAFACPAHLRLAIKQRESQGNVSRNEIMVAALENYFKNGDSNIKKEMQQELQSAIASLRRELREEIASIKYYNE